MPNRLATAAVLLLAAIFAACGHDKSNWSDEQLHLTPQQAQGRKLYDRYCLSCHSAYSEKKRNGPPLVGLCGRKAMPSGAPPTDERLSAVIMRGRRTMPGFSEYLQPPDLDALLAYLHTL